MILSSIEKLSILLNSIITIGLCYAYLENGSSYNYVITLLDSWYSYCELIVYLIAVLFLQILPWIYIYGTYILVKVSFRKMKLNQSENKNENKNEYKKISTIFNMNIPYFIGIAGASGCGKSTLSELIFAKCDNEENLITIIHMDNYYLGGDENTNYDCLEAFDIPLLLKHVTMLKNGDSIKMPQYSFKTHQREEFYVTVYPTAILIVEGIFALAQKEIREHFNVKAYVQAEGEYCLARRIERDIKERGRELGQILEQYQRDVVPANMNIVNPSKNHADIVIQNNNNFFIGFGIFINHVKQVIKEYESQLVSCEGM